MRHESDFDAAAAVSSLRVWTLAARPKTLAAAAAPVVVGTAMAVEAGAFHAASALFALVGALLIQIGTNYSNDYLDFERGADTSERKGPLRVTQAGLVSPRVTRRAATLAFGLAAVAGLYLVWRGGWPVVLIGVCSIASGVWYTAGRYSLAYLGLADLFVLVFFGPVAVGGTYYVQALELSAAVIVAGLGPGLLATAILLVNNIRDVDEDRAAGKETLVVRFGRGFGIGLYAVCVLAAAVVPIALYSATGRHPWAMAAVVVLPLAGPIVGTLRRTSDADAFNPLLGATARLLVIYSVIFSGGWNL